MRGSPAVGVLQFVIGLFPVGSNVGGGVVETSTLACVGMDALGAWVLHADGYGISDGPNGVDVRSRPKRAFSMNSSERCRRVVISASFSSRFLSCFLRASSVKGWEPC